MFRSDPGREIDSNENSEDHFDRLGPLHRGKFLGGALWIDTALVAGTSAVGKFFYLPGGLYCRAGSLAERVAQWGQELAESLHPMLVSAH